jgi:hypothetical protein
MPTRAFLCIVKKQQTCAKKEYRIERFSSPPGG